MVKRKFGKTQFPFLAASLTIACQIALWPLTASAAIANEMTGYGQAIEFQGIQQWYNSPPLSMAGLRGKVILVDFWTYACVNCLNTLPYLKQWYAKYKDSGLIVIGVHTPEFGFEKSAVNLQSAIQRLGISYPIAQDNLYATWKAYDNQYWPALYLIDRNGRVVLKHAGEGGYRQTESAIRALLAAPTVH